MTDLEPMLRDGSASAAERALLRAGHMGASMEARERALTAVTSVVLATAAAGAGSGAAKIGWASVAKWAGTLGVVAIGAGAVGVAATQPRAERAMEEPTVPTVLVEATASAPVAPEPSRTAAPTATRVLAAPPRVVPRVVPPAMASVAPPSLSAELGSLDEARGAIATGDPARALRELDAYGARFPRGSLAQEATMLRIEALVKVGDRPAAKALADAFLAASPASPYAERVRLLIGSHDR
jgi:hypothetical protein